MRLTLGFAAAVAVVLSVVGVFAYHRLAAGLSDDLNRELRQRAQDLIVPVSQRSSSLPEYTGSGFIEHGESFAELLTPSGGVQQSTASLRGEPLLSRAEASAAVHGMIFLNRPEVPGLNEPARLLAIPVNRAGRESVLVVGATRENGLEVLNRVRTQLLIGLPLLLLVTSVFGYLLACAALRPVEEMRRRAAMMSGGAAGQRLPLPASNDEVTRLGVTLNELLARVDATRERAFVSNASHELRTPLALVKTELELAVRRPRQLEELTGAIRSATDEVDRLIRLAEDLLLLASVDESPLHQAREQLDATTLMSEVAGRFTQAAARSGRHLGVQPGDVQPVEADPLGLERALLNLVSNALQHGAGDITLSVRESEGSVEFHVSDEGIGFSPEMLAHGFDRFVHAPSTGGSGLGLAIRRRRCFGARRLRRSDQPDSGWVRRLDSTSKGRESASRLCLAIRQAASCGVSNDSSGPDPLAPVAPGYMGNR